MLISVTLENWMSFRESTTFSMIAYNKDKTHSDRLFHAKDYNIKILPIAAIFGGNASGKSNFIKAIEFVRSIIRGEFVSPQLELYDTDSHKDESRATIPVDTFILDDKFTDKPCRFEFKFLIDKVIYGYAISVNRNEILHEKLTKIVPSEFKSGKSLIQFERKNNNIIIPEYSELDKNTLDTTDIKEVRKTFFQHLAQKGITVFNPIAQMLAGIDIIFPNIIEIASDFSDKYYKKFGSFLSDMDTGISMVELKELKKGEYDESQKQVAERILQFFPVGRVVPISHGSESPTRFFIKTDKGVIAQELVTYHANNKAKDTEMGTAKESDGTRRLIDLTPLLFRLFSQNSQIVIIDELDRSLHSLLTRELIYLYLEKCDSTTKKQLVFTTHDSDLFEMEELRLDEIKLARRSNDGNTSISSLADEDIENRKNLRDNYLKGYFGGVPHIFGGDY